MGEALIILFASSLHTWPQESNRAKKGNKGEKERCMQSHCLLHIDEFWSVCKLSDERIRTGC